MAEDPVIRQCMGAIEGARAASPRTAKVIAAYERQRARREIDLSGARLHSAG